MSNTNIRPWAARIVATVAVSAMLALGVGAASASAQPAAAARAAHSTVANGTREAASSWQPIYVGSYNQCYNYNQRYNRYHRDGHYYYRHPYRIIYYGNYYNYRGHRYHKVYVLFWFE